MKRISGLFSGIMGFMIFGLMIFGFMIHIKTIIIAYHVSGYFACFLTLMLPFFSNIAWLLFSWSKAGFVNSYSVLCYAWIGCAVIAFICAYIAHATDRDETPIDVDYEMVD